VGVEWSAPQACEVFGGKAELGQNLLVRNALATVEGGARGGNLAGFFLRDRLIVHGGMSETAGDRIGHHGEQMHDRGNLAGSQTLDQFMSLLFFVRSMVCHKNPFQSDPHEEEDRRRFIFSA
jgi:hypothetical protein